MAASPASPYARSLVCAAKRLRISSTAPICQPPIAAQCRNLQTKPLPESLENELAQLRLPRAVQATYMAPLKHRPTHNIQVCDLQLRSYSVRNLEVFADFALRAAYYLHLPATGPRPLPRIIERWTVPRSNFVHKKSQENFERITLRRCIQIKDGHPDTVGLWLSFLQKYRYYGVGMKANVWEHGTIGATKELDEEAESIRKMLGEELESFSSGASAIEKLDALHLEEKLHLQPFKGRWGAFGPMGAAAAVPKATERISQFIVQDAASKKAAQASEIEEEATAADFAPTQGVPQK